MAITLLISAGAVLALGGLFVVATQAAGRVALASDNTAVGLRDSAADTLTEDGAPKMAPAEWNLATVNDLSEAEDLLDGLEAHGYEDRELVVLGNSCFAVRWR